MAATILSPTWAMVLATFSSTGFIVMTLFLPLTQEDCSSVGVKHWERGPSLFSAMRFGGGFVSRRMRASHACRLRLLQGPAKRLDLFSSARGHLPREPDRLR